MVIHLWATTVDKIRLIGRPRIFPTYKRGFTVDSAPREGKRQLQCYSRDVPHAARNEER